MSEASTHREIPWEKIHSWLFAAVLLGVCAYGAMSLSGGSIQIECDGEEVALRYREPHFIAGDFALNRGEWQSNEFARSGTHSLKLDAERPFGWDSPVCELKGTETIRLSVWRFNPNGKAQSGKLVTTCDGFWQAAEEVVETNEAGWERIFLEVQVPAESRNKPLKIYCWNPATEAVYFDDLKVEVSWPGVF